ncbi:hypothetical protein C453_15883 [Haloferax elongans ATCC BAA-1513]|uniref:DUF7979 domain-containing protein n=1 Tax=Haloferax elongans ATCC BAA-1513 TaxID=1230453 RepID=M0HDL7_HALEO|nr:hypothetical protein [Haloferax elongans]ELZ82580.1 hypothetical protein C453_15883 [Haloferax elongans ATCC BAA-1513]
MPRIALQAVLVVSLVLLAGCATTTPTAPPAATSAAEHSTAAPPESTSAATTSTSGTTTTTATSTTATPTSTSATSGYGHGTQFVSISQNDPGNCSSEAVTCRTFENLTADQRQTFQRVRDHGQLTFRPNETNPFDYYDESRPEFVNHEGTWYFVRVAVR